MIEVRVITPDTIESGFELTQEEADFIIDTGYKYTDRTYRNNDKFSAVAMSSVTGDIIIKSVRKEHIKRDKS